jgi:fatty-acyl-CoA synthase
MTGAKLVFPGAALDGKSVYELIGVGEQVTRGGAGVPTVWQGLLAHVERRRGCASRRLKRHA